MSDIVKQILVGLIGIPLGVVILIYKERIVFTFGKMDWAEQRLGSGGTYNIWVLIGLGLVIGSFLYMIGSFPYLQ